jgi:hypothetical protein
MASCSLGGKWALRVTFLNVPLPFERCYPLPHTGELGRTESSAFGGTQQSLGVLSGREQKLTVTLTTTSLSKQ